MGDTEKELRENEAVEPAELAEPAVDPQDEIEEEPAAEEDLGDAGDAGELGELVEAYVTLGEVPEARRDDDWTKAERDCRERINRRYWMLLFSRLAEVVVGSPSTSLAFTEEDGRLFDFGWVDEKIFPADKLAYDHDFSDKTYEVRDLRAHMAATDAEFLLVNQRAKLAEGMARVRQRIEELTRQIFRCAAERDGHEGKLPATYRGQLSELDKFIDGSTVALTTLENLKKSRGLAGDQVRAYSNLRNAYNAAVGKRDLILKRAGEAAEPVIAANATIRNSKVAAVALVENLEQLGAALTASETEAERRRTHRRGELEERLGEIREDVTMCGRWGRTTASPVLLQDRDLNSKAAVVEAIRRVEDFDPGLFANRKTERAGRPRVVLTPGIGNGSYDFRSNILIVPRTSPRSTLVSVAFALALYRRDVDKSYGEGKLWRSFLDDVAWGKLGGVPRSVQAQMRTFVRAYTNWAAREAAGHTVLAPELRAWFEQNIAPSTGGPITPRGCRGLPASRRDKMIEELEPAAASAEELHALGCLQWMRRDYARALEYFERSAEVAEGFAPTQWALAACYRLSPDSLKLDIGTPERLGRACTALKGFAQLAEQSWWTRRARNLAGELQSRIDEMRRSSQ